jgi:hypothetical protein
MSGWLDLKRTAEYCSLSIRTLRRYIGDPHHPLPVRLVGGKWLSHPGELAAWIQSFPAGRADIDRYIEEILRELPKGAQHGQKTTRGLRGN